VFPSEEAINKLSSRIKLKQHQITTYDLNYRRRAHQLESDTRCYTDELVKQIVVGYSRLNESFLIVPKEHVLYQAESVPDLTDWLIAYSRKEKKIKETINFRTVISRTLKSLD